MTDATKICSRCEMRKPVAQFARGSKNPDGLQRWCNACRSERRSQLACRVIVTEKVCKGCKLTLPVERFHRSAIMKDGRQARCVACHATAYNVAENARARRKSDPEYAARLAMLHAAKARAKKHKAPFALTLADIVIPSTCPVLGIALQFNAKGMHPTSPSLDKIIPALGYVPGNVAVISFLANKIKGDHTDPEFFEKIAAYLRRSTALAA